MLMVMKNISFFCLTLNPDHKEMIEKLSLIPVGLGEKKFSSNFFSDKDGLSISEKILFTGSILFIIGCGKTTWIKFKLHGLDFVNIENFL